MAQVLLQNVTKVFDGKVVAVHSASIEIADGEFMVVVGPSGCGKTTMLRLVDGLEELTEGTIKIGETTVNNVPPKDRDTAMVFQNYALYPHMTVSQNMSFGLKIRKVGKDRIEERVRQTAEMLDIEKLLERKPFALSGGQRQRVALGRAIVRDPKVFLFDEPLSNLDAQMRVATRAELKTLHQKLRTTSIYVTHDQSEAMTLGDRICVLYNGVIQQVAEPLEVYYRPANRFVAGFFGTSSMNFINGRIGYDGDKVMFITADGTAIALADAMKEGLVKYKDSQAVLGVRPEHISFEPAEGQNCNYIIAKAEVVELFGDRMEIHLSDKAGQKYIANPGPNAKIKMNDTVRLYIDINRVYMFQSGTNGKNIFVR
ncbi:MAG: sn-glycerol-3-phosphate ABC transporter ATP-binding protein UgpC [Candidatus Brocadiia bacterium]|nr:MAG: sn-glycerol-3-phosphate ABC transporter ATP-binding protein UgpC [Candidatus Brocadiia bacterium]